MSEPIIKFRRVRKRFGPKIIYRNLQLDVFKGETLVVMGGSGVGKSVMLKLLIRLLEADGGSITFHGEEVTKMDEERLRFLRQNVAMLFQGAALFDSLSVGDNVAYALREHFRETMTEQEIAERVDWALSSVDLPGIEEMRPADLSGGMRKRVGLARSVALQPEVVLYDEPTTGLDPIMSGVINELIREIVVEMGATAMTITHDMSSVRAIADNVAMIHGGKVRWTGPVADMDASGDPYLEQFITGSAEGPIESVR